MQLTKSMIRERIGEPSFGRGERYWRDGRVFDPRRCGDRIEASCAGRRDPYRLWATLGDEGITEALCSCPVGAGGACKHVAAMLLTWLDTPEDFEETVPVEDRLEALSKDQLLLIVRTVLERDPGLDWVLDMVTPREEQEDTEEAVASDPYYRKALFCIPDFPDWQATSGAAHTFEEIADIGDRFAEAGKHADAAAVFRGVIRAALEGYEMLHDEGQISWVITRCVGSLGDCLEELVQGSADRRAAFDSLFSVFAFDMRWGGISLSDDLVGILECAATAGEREELAQRARDLLAPGGEEDALGGWTQKAVGGFILDMEKHLLDDEEFLQLCRETGRTGDVVDRLLSTDRIEEALSEAAACASDYTLLSLADIFSVHGREDAFADILAQRAQGEETDVRALEWLRDHYEETGRQSEGLDMALRAFKKRPGLDAYRVACRIAGPQQARIDAQLIQFLRERNSGDTLVEIYLSTDRHDEAVGILRSPEQALRPFMGTELRAAAVLAGTHPEVASSIYLDEATTLINRRGRSNYHAACGYLKQARDILRKQGKDNEWASLIEGLRIAHRGLPALKDELARACL